MGKMNFKHFIVFMGLLFFTSKSSVNAQLGLLGSAVSSLTGTLLNDNGLVPAVVGEAGNVICDVGEGVANLAHPGSTDLGGCKKNDGSGGQPGGSEPKGGSDSKPGHKPGSSGEKSGRKPGGSTGEPGRKPGGSGRKPGCKPKGSGRKAGRKPKGSGGSWGGH